MTNAASLALEVATFKNKLDNQPRKRTVEWVKIATALCTHVERKTKDGPLWSPTLYRDGLPRGNAGVEAITAAVGDFDTGIRYEEVEKRLEQYEYVAHSTFSHKPTLPKFRVILPFVQPVPIALWRDVKARIDEYVFGLASDPAAKDAARIYYLPACPPNGARFSERHEGELLDPLLLPPATQKSNEGTAEGRDETSTRQRTQLGKAALDFVANGAPLGEQRRRALAAARNYLSAGNTVEETASAIWRGLQASPQDPEREPWTFEDALAIARDLAENDAPPLEADQPLPPRCEMRRAGLGYVLTFPTDGVTITADRIRRRGDGLAAEITVEASLPAVPRYVTWGTLNLASISGRKTFITQIEKRARAAGVDWESIIEDVCRKVAISERSGEPFQTVGNLPPAEALTWHIRNFAPRNEGMTIFGEGGSGKSLTALAMALSVQTGEVFVPGYGPLDTGPVLYLDWEAQPARLDKRIKQLCAGRGISPVDMAYRRCAGSLCDQIEEILRFCQSEGIVMVVVDSVEAAMAGNKGEDRDPNDSIQRLYDALRLLKCTAILIDHVSKEGLREKRGNREPIGGVAKVNRARMAYEIRKASDTVPGALNIGLYNTKRNDDGPLMKPVGLRVEFGEGTARYYRDDLTDPDLSAGLTNADRIALSLAKGTLAVKAIAEATGLTEASVTTTLNRARDKRFIKMGDAKNSPWGLIAQEEAEGSWPPF